MLKLADSSKFTIEAPKYNIIMKVKIGKKKLRQPSLCAHLRKTAGGLFQISTALQCSK